MDATLMKATEAMTAGDGESDHDELVKALRKAIDACHKSEIKQIKAERDEAVKLLQAIMAHQGSTYDFENNYKNIEQFLDKISV